MHRPICRSTLALLGLTCLTLVGCSAQRLATQAVSFNLTVERAQNEMLLLNVIRAKDRLPMYLSGISGLTGNVQTALTSSLGSTYTDARAKKVTTAEEITDTLTRAYTPSVGATFSKNPTFTLAVLDTQEFMRGFLAPLGKDTLNYYWTQGWPRELLLYLLVQRVEIQEKDQPLKVLRNYPNSADPNVSDMKGFAQWVQTEFLAKDPQIESVPVPVNIGPELPAAEVTNLRKLIELAKEGLLLKKVETQAGQEERYQLQKQQTDLRFRLASDPADPKVAADKSQYNQTVARQTEMVAVTQIGTKTVTFVLRSPEALIYYLGELTRLENREKNPLTPYVCIQGQYQPLFVALPSGSCDDTLVDADTGRERYSIPPTKLASSTDTCTDGSLDLRKPDCEGGRSMQALRLLNQIISLHKSAKDNPSTALVRVID